MGKGGNSPKEKEGTVAALTIIFSPVFGLPAPRGNGGERWGRLSVTRSLRVTCGNGEERWGEIVSYKESSGCLAVPALLPCSPVAFLRRLLWDNHAVGLVRRPWYRARARSFGSRCCQVGAAALEFIFCRSRNAVMVEKSNSSKKAAKSQSAGHATDWSERAHAGDKRPSGGHALAANGA